MTKEDEDLLAGAVTFIRYQHPAFRDRMLALARRLSADAAFCRRFILDHYDEKPDTDDVYLFYNQLLEMPVPRGDWKAGEFFDAIQSADRSAHTTAAEVMDAVIMACFYRQENMLSGRRGFEHHLARPISSGEKGGWKIDS
ncbi:MAG: hypothetical protein GC185_06460 [Alphaproteobacteria bacterium]|nr:hypothetical protein [Alphaproteobacteria bacterium]